jgi:hypothetical protein
VPGAKRVLYDDTTRQIFDLEPQAPATGHLGDAVQDRAYRLITRVTIDYCPRHRH